MLALALYENQLNNAWNQFDTIQGELEALDEEEHACVNEYNQSAFLFSNTTETLRRERSTNNAVENKSKRRNIRGFRADFICLGSTAQSFYDTFSSTIDRNESLTTVKELHYLCSSLTEIAAQSIQSLDTTEANYAIVLATLKEKFDWPRQISMRH
jgi:hypothetical protein